MSLILRVDIDKPYGNANLFTKIMSKLCEDYWFPLSDSLGYLCHHELFLEYCNSKKISGYMYHRRCTRPNKRIIELTISGKHQLGFHSENTRTFETFSKELSFFVNCMKPIRIGSFTKHGSGNIKLGKDHYAPYEPEKYREWSKKIGVDFIFGNGICKGEKYLLPENNFYADMFWMERPYRDKYFFEIKDLINAAKEKDVVVLIHPCNFHALKEVAADFKEIVEMAEAENVNWKII